jgi:hypothetical protein
MSHLDEIVKAVIYKSREIGNPVTETLAAFVAQTLLKLFDLNSSPFCKP